MKSKILKLTSLLLFIFSLASCNKRLESTGYLVSQNKLDLIKVNQISKRDVINILGQPTTQSSFSPKAYYYMERQYEQAAFFSPKLKEQRVVSIEFNQNDIVSNVKIYGKNDAKTLSYDAEKVTFEGNKVGAFSQILENVGKFNSQAQRKAVK